MEVLGIMLVTGAIKGWIDNLFKPVNRPLIEHIPLRSKRG